MRHYQEFLDFANQLADSARPIALKYFRQEVQAEYKIDKTPVTIADKEIEQTLRMQIQARYPEHAILGEEFGNSNEGAEFCWVLDPIDGTRAFIAGVATFTTLIGLVHNSLPVLGVVDQPVSNERWSAVYSGHLPELLPHSSTASLAGKRFATTSEGYFSPVQEEAIVRMRAQGAEIAFGGDAYAYMMMIEGRLDAVFDVGFKPYDILPMMPVLQKAGLWLGFFEDRKHVTRVTNNVVVAREQRVGEQILRELTAD